MFTSRVSASGESSSSVLNFFSIELLPSIGDFDNYTIDPSNVVVVLESEYETFIGIVGKKRGAYNEIRGPTPLLI